MLKKIILSIVMFGPSYAMNGLSEEEQIQYALKLSAQEAEIPNELTWNGKQYNVEKRNSSGRGNNCLLYSLLGQSFPLLKKICEGSDLNAEDIWAGLQGKDESNVNLNPLREVIFNAILSASVEPGNEKINAFMQKIGGFEAFVGFVKNQETLPVEIALAMSHFYKTPLAIFKVEEKAYWNENKNDCIKFCLESLGDISKQIYEKMALKSRGYNSFEHFLNAAQPDDVIQALKDSKNLQKDMIDFVKGMIEGACTRKKELFSVSNDFYNIGENSIFVLFEGEYNGHYSKLRINY